MNTAYVTTFHPGDLFFINLNGLGSVTILNKDDERMGHLYTGDVVMLIPLVPPKVGPNNYLRVLTRFGPGYIHRSAIDSSTQ
jgi:hypothetical protein